MFDLQPETIDALKWGFLNLFVVFVFVSGLYVTWFFPDEPQDSLIDPWNKIRKWLILITAPIMIPVCLYQLYLVTVELLK